jgi:hypothetical protein
MNPLFPSKILVSTGPKFLDTGCTTPVMIEVTLVPPGQLHLGLLLRLANST